MRTALRTCLGNPWQGKACLGTIICVTLFVGLALGTGLGYLVGRMSSPSGQNAEDAGDTATTTISPTTRTIPTTHTIPTSTPTPAPPVTGPDCVPRDYGFGSFVCVCNATYCDTRPRVRAVEPEKALVFTSTAKALRLHREELAFSSLVNGSGAAQTLTVHRDQTYQSVYGFGGAFTDAAGINILSLPEDAQDMLLRSYFSEDGLEYNMGRVPIGGTDFSTREYSYDDKDDNGPDPTLGGFQLQPEDLKYKIPIVRRAKQMMGNRSDDLLLFSAAWSPPAWMKTSGQLSGFGSLKEEYYQTYADYIVKFLEKYAALGVQFHCVSTGNEPLNGIIPFKHFNAMGWTPANMAKWIKGHLGPTIRNSTFKDIKIMAHDDQRILLPWELERVLADNATAKYVDIIGYHWYLNFITPDTILDKLHKLWPDKPIISSEACNGDKPWQLTRVEPGSWHRAELYLEDIINVMNHWTTAWMDWNLALNPDGGPTWSSNFVDACIIVDANKGEFYRNPTYYALAHVAKFVPRGSVRLGLTSKGGPWMGGKVNHVAFRRPDAGIALALINRHDDAHHVTIKDQDRGQLSFELPARSFVTVIYW